MMTSRTHIPISTSTWWCSSRPRILVSSRESSADARRSIEDTQARARRRERRGHVGRRHASTSSRDGDGGDGARVGDPRVRVVSDAEARRSFVVLLREGAATGTRRRLVRGAQRLRSTATTDSAPREWACLRRARGACREVYGGSLVSGPPPPSPETSCVRAEVPRRLGPGGPRRTRRPGGVLGERLPLRRFLRANAHPLVRRGTSTVRPARASPDGVVLPRAAGEGVRVYVVMTGVRATHREFDANLVGPRVLAASDALSRSTPRATPMRRPRDARRRARRRRTAGPPRRRGVLRARARLRGRRVRLGRRARSPVNRRDALAAGDPPAILLALGVSAGESSARSSAPSTRSRNAEARSSSPRRETRDASCCD